MNNKANTCSEISDSGRLKAEVRLKALRAVKKELSGRQLLEELKVFLGVVNYAVRDLLERGLVKVNSFSRSDI